MRGKRTEEFKAVQRESTQVAAELRKALFSLRLARSTSPIQRGFPSLGRLRWVIRTSPNGTTAYWWGA